MPPALVYRIIATLCRAGFAPLPKEPKKVLAVNISGVGAAAIKPNDTTSMNKDIIATRKSNRSVREFVVAVLSVLNWTAGRFGFKYWRRAAATWMS